MTAQTSQDVTILGGGLAGLTLARQLSLARPGTRILIAEASAHPPPTAAHKVGESCVEIGGGWLHDTLELADHLNSCQLPKLGLRFFLPGRGKDDISQRLEMGPIRKRIPVPFNGLLLPSYQLDRGRLETFLAQDLPPEVQFLDRCKATAIELADGPDALHQVQLDHRGETRTVQTRWVIDGTGRRARLRKQLGLGRPSRHKASAVWFRFAGRVKPDTWSQDPEWTGRMAQAIRWQSTTHLMDRGYWVWFIPLPSNHMSVGIVIDDKVHDLSDIADFERAMAWLDRHEAQAAEQIRRALGDAQPLDFHTRRQYPSEVTQTFSADRWGLTGDAGCFVDPFYSPGTDFIGITNSFHTDLITRDLDGQDIRDRAARSEHYYQIVYEQFLRVYHDAYPLMGNSQVMAAKLAFDSAFYWGWATLLFRNGGLTDPDFMDTIPDQVARMIDVQAAMQRTLRQWAEREDPPLQSGMIDQFEITTLWRLYVSLIRRVDADTLRYRVTKNLDIIEAMSEVIFRRAARDFPRVQQAERLNARAFSLDPSRWDADGLFDGPERTPEYERVRDEMQALWIDGSLDRIQPAPQSGRSAAGL